MRQDELTGIRDHFETSIDHLVHVEAALAVAEHTADTPDVQDARQSVSAALEHLWVAQRRLIRLAD